MAMGEPDGDLCGSPRLDLLWLDILGKNGSQHKWLAPNVVKVYGP